MRESTTQSQRSAFVTRNRRSRVRCSTCSWGRKASISNWSAARERAELRRVRRSESSIEIIAQKAIQHQPHHQLLQQERTFQQAHVIPNRPESIRKLVKKLGPAQQLRVCYEAGPTGYVLYWQLTALGVKCEVVAPTLVRVKAGDRVKTDRRDALKLARSYRAGDLTAVWVPDAAHEALRDLVRAREAAKKDQLRARHRLGKFLLRHGRRPATKINAWTQKHLNMGEDGAL
jgi:transposase